MKITELRLKTHCINDLHDFYAGTLGFEVLSHDDNTLVLNAGRTRLVFEQDDTEQWVYHFAFNIPHNQFDEAKNWLAQRTSLMTFDGKDEIAWTAWDAKAVYFGDPAGNIGEFIARYKLPNASETPFSARSITGVSEIGLGVDDVSGRCDDLQAAAGLGVWDAGDGEIFRALGDAYGLFIVVKLERNWFPTHDRPAKRAPVALTMMGDRNATYEMPGLPYTITVSKSEI